ncbi:helix-turn-helix domain-containing protein [Actinomadura hibisca]|uniref:helix-turn-helix domain-containing protein n=1 Tax=Actinomadura hibisca TaxID=68565 RepID=UPI0008346643|nr:helix-turn-helix transcriptional regulator [Actinomadura hibisca]
MDEPAETERAADDGIGGFLRSRRARLRPEDVGLPATGRYRRVPGLRREELAQLAGVSVAYLTRLEQDRGDNVSDEVLDAIARALRLTANERAHLVHLARNRHRKGTAPPEQRQVRAALQGMLAAMEDVPAYITGWRSDILAWNRMAAALFGDWDGTPPQKRNWIRLLFLSPDHRRLFADWEARAAEAVGALRLDAGQRLDDPELAALVDEVSARSPEFRRLWATHDVKEKSHGTRRLHHPVAGDLELSFESFRLPDDSEQCLTVYHAPPGSATVENLRLLASWGTDAARDALRHPR